MRGNIEVVVFEEDLDDEIPTNPEEFMLFWAEKIKLIPNEFKVVAEITIESNAESNADHEYSSYLDVKIAYTRVETEGEELNRKEKETSRLKDHEKREIQTLRTLKAKYPDV